jgi:hypothetical protein
MVASGHPDITGGHLDSKICGIVHFLRFQYQLKNVFLREENILFVCLCNIVIGFYRWFEVRKQSRGQTFRS